MTFANPIWFYALSGLLIPIAIHLWNKKELKTIPVGSVLWFPKGSSKKSRSIKLRDLLLLFLRLSIISLLVLILVEPLIKSSKKADEKAVFIDPDLNLEEDQRLSVIIDSLANNGYSKYWLAIDFPNCTEPKPKATLDQWSLIEDVDDGAYGDAIVFASPKLNKVEGIRPEVINNVSIVFTDQNEVKNEFVLENIASEANNYIVKGISTPSVTSFNKSVSTDNRNAAAIELKDSLHIKIKAGEKFESDADYIRDAIESIRQYTRWPIAFTDNDQPDLLIWLDTNKYKGNALNIITYKSVVNDSYFKTAEAANHHFLTKRIKGTDRKLNELPGELLTLLRPMIADYSSAIKSNDIRTIADNQLMPERIEGTEAAFITRSFNHLLFFLLFTILTIERILASKKAL